MCLWNVTHLTNTEYGRFCFAVGALFEAQAQTLVHDIERNSQQEEVHGQEGRKVHIVEVFTVKTVSHQIETLIL